MKKFLRHKAARARARKSRSGVPFESLEARMMLTTVAWTNLGNPLNVNGDLNGAISPVDVVRIVNEINNRRFSDAETGKLPTSVDGGNDGFHFDVNCDGFVSPTDVVRVVNFINRNGAGSQHSGTGGIYPNLECSPVLAENEDFASSFSQRLRLPNDRSAIEVHFQQPEFDTASEDQIRDAFEIEIADADGSPLAFSYSQSTDASFNWTEGHDPVVATGVKHESPAGEDSKVTVNLAGVPANTVVEISTRLVNNDSDNNSHVVLRGFQIIESADPAPVGVQFAAAAPIGEPHLIDESQLDDLTPSFTAAYGRTSLAGDNSELITELTVTNHGRQAIVHQLIVAVNGFSTLDAYALRPDGFLRDGRPYFDLSAKVQGQALASGESVSSSEIRFLNRGDERFTYDLQVLGQVNVAPEFESDPQSLVEAGSAFDYDADATDPDGHPLSYSLASGPAGAKFNPASGQIAWATTAEDLGAHKFTVRATDPHGLFAEQIFSVQVIDAIPNRPPNFVSEPITRAIASSGFEVTTVAVGDAPTDIATISGFRGPRLVAINSGDQTVSVHAGENNDRFDDVTTISTGEPIPTGHPIEAGYTLDIGLPAFTSRSDANDVLGLDQGDFNGDGILDLVTMTYSFTLNPRANVFRIVSLIGDGDGNFAPPEIIGEPEHKGNSKLYQPTIADINGDDVLDVVAIDAGTGSLYTIFGNGDGSFQPMISKTLETSFNDFRLIDLDADGNLDLLGRAATNATDFGWMRGNGDGTFGEYARLAEGGGALGSANSRPYDVGDIDGDGDNDIVMVHFSSRELRILLNDGVGVFEPGPTFTDGNFFNTFYPRIGDFTGDQVLDIFVAANGSVKVYAGDGSGTNFEIVESDTNIVGISGNGAGSDQPVDFDGDGDLDIVVAEAIMLRGTQLSPTVLTNDGSGKFTPTYLPITDFPGQLSEHNQFNGDIASGALFGDYNRDGIFDVSYYTAGLDFNGVGIRAGTRPGEFGNSRSIVGTSSNVGLGGVYAADFDQDGIADILTLSDSLMRLGLGDVPSENPSSRSNWPASTTKPQSQTSTWTVFRTS